MVVHTQFPTRGGETDLVFRVVAGQMHSGGNHVIRDYAFREYGITHSEKSRSEKTRSRRHQINFRLAKEVQETSVGVAFPDQWLLACEIKFGLVRANPLCVVFPVHPLVA